MRRLVTPHLALVAGIVAGTAVLVGLDVALSLGAAGEPSGAPPVAPQLRLYFVPVFAVVIAIMALIANALLGVGRRLRRTGDWGLLGASYSLVMTALPLMRLGIPVAAATLLSTVLPAVFAYLVVHRAAPPAR